MPSDNRTTIKRESKVPFVGGFGHFTTATRKDSSGKTQTGVGKDENSARAALNKKTR